MSAARSGVYCSPLRLLACEVAERLSGAGVPCRLVTGQEVGGDQRAKHVACTVEMASLSEEVEVGKWAAEEGCVMWAGLTLDMVQELRSR